MVCPLNCFISCWFALGIIISYVTFLKNMVSSVGQTNIMIFVFVWTLLNVSYRVAVSRFKNKLNDESSMLNLGNLEKLFGSAGLIIFLIYIWTPSFSRPINCNLQLACAFGAFAFCVHSLAFLVTCFRALFETAIQFLGSDDSWLTLTPGTRRWTI